MRRGITATRTLAAAAVLAALGLTASPASAATSANSSLDGGTAATSAQPPANRPTEFGSVSGSGAVAVNPDCVLSWIPDKTGTRVNAHISTFLLRKHRIRAVKVNAQIKCRRVSMDLSLQVTLWKTGLIFPHQVTKTTTTLGKGNLLKNQRTWEECKNLRRTTYYATASGVIWFQGVKYTAALQTPKKVPLACGT